MRPVIYIAGKISAPSAAGIAQNIHRFDIMENHLMKMGYAPINPASDWNAAMLGGLEKDDFMEKDRAIIAKCDGIVFLQGWTESGGARQEMAWAKEFGIDIFYSLAEVCGHYGRSE